MARDVSPPAVGTGLRAATSIALVMWWALEVPRFEWSLATACHTFWSFLSLLGEVFGFMLPVLEQSVVHVIAVCSVEHVVRTYVDSLVH